MDVLGIEVERAELERWLGWCMPTVQPFLVPRDLAAERQFDDDPGRLTMELGDTFGIYGTQADAVCWLDREASRDLPADVRRRRLGRHAWPCTDPDADVLRLVRYLVEHAAVTLDEGLALHKPSQGWQSPTKVLTATEVKLSARARGRRLSRYRLR